MRSLGAVGRYALATVARSPGLVTLFIVLGTVPAVVDPSGGLATAFGYVHQLLVLYATALVVVTVAGADGPVPRSRFARRLGRATLRLTSLVPYGLALVVANAAVEWTVYRVIAPGAAGTILAPLVVPLALAPFVFAPVATVADRTALPQALRVSLAISRRHRSHAGGLVLAFVAVSAGGVAVQAVGAATGGATAVAVAEAAGTFLGTVLLLPVLIAITRVYLDAGATAAAASAPDATPDPAES